MIDTNKYENITPERWTVDEEDPCRVVDAQDCTIARTDFVSIDEEREWQLANAQLIADAPDLLAEVKRLRDLHILACDYLQGISDGTLPDSEWPHIHAMIRGDEE